MAARENILARIRKAQGRAGSQPGEPELRAARERIAQHEAGPQPAIAHTADPLAHFLSECGRLSTTHARLGAIEALPQEVARYLRQAGAGPKLVAWPEFAGLDWTAAGIEAEFRPAGGDDRTGLTGCFCAIAETGTVLLLTSPATPKLTAILPDTHVCVVRESRLLETLEAAFALMRRETGHPPRALTFISGPSRTADIEQTIVIGAHGPYRVHVVLVP